MALAILSAPPLGWSEKVSGGELVFKRSNNKIPLLHIYMNQWRACVSQDTRLQPGCIWRKGPRNPQEVPSGLQPTTEVPCTADLHNNNTIKLIYRLVNDISYVCI